LPEEDRVEDRQELAELLELELVVVEDSVPLEMF
jgi:hypothetical protein